MLVIPAIDIINGECVRLLKGDFNQKKVYSKDPLEVAKKWQSMGAEWIHIVDLDGAKEGVLKNIDIAIKIKQNTNLKIEYGGGIRSKKKLMSVIDSGIDRAITGIWLVEDSLTFSEISSKYKNRFIISVDFDSNGDIYKNGWQSKTNYNVLDLIPVLEQKNIDEIIITNISRDGTLKGVDFNIVENLLKKTAIKFIIAGGVLSIDDIFKLKNLEKKGISGVIIGKALYEGTINLKDALEISKL